MAGSTCWDDEEDWWPVALGADIVNAAGALRMLGVRLGARMGLGCSGQSSANRAECAVDLLKKMRSRADTTTSLYVMIPPALQGKCVQHTSSLVPPSNFASIHLGFRGLFFQPL